MTWRDQRCRIETPPSVSYRIVVSENAGTTVRAKAPCAFSYQPLEICYEHLHELSALSSQAYGSSDEV